MLEDLELFNKIARTLFEAENEKPVIDYLAVDRIDEVVDLSLQDEALDPEVYEKAVTDVVLNAPRSTTKLFFNQLFGGRNGKAVLGELLACLLNNSMATYKAAGIMTALEKEVTNKVCDLAGLGPNSGGTFAPGGSMSIFMGMLMARDAFNSNIQHEGVNGRKMIGYSSTEAHYSIAKNATFLGLGRDNIRYIKVDDKGRMIPEELEKQILIDIEAGGQPFFVNATAGTTVLAAFDPIDEISKVCKKHNIWLHVDGSYCGAVIFSDKYKAFVKGLEHADSFNLNAHKMLATPLSCSMIFAKNKEHLYNSCSNEASYLYQTGDDAYNLGKISLQCGRRNDALKFWTLWKNIGTKALGKMVEHEFDLADVAREYVRSNPDYTLYSNDNSVSVCFNYKGIDAKRLCTQLYEKGEIMVGYGSFRDDEFVRLVTINPGNQKSDILHFFEKLEEFVSKNEDILIEESVIG